MKPSISFISSSIARFIQVLFYVAAMGTPPLAVISAQSSRIAHNDPLYMSHSLDNLWKTDSDYHFLWQKMYACHLIISHSFEWTVNISSCLLYHPYHFHPCSIHQNSDFPFCLVCFTPMVPHLLEASRFFHDPWRLDLLPRRQGDLPAAKVLTQEPQGPQGREPGSVAEKSQVRKFNWS